MGVTITEEFRTEFEQVGPDGVRKRINSALYSNEKQKAAHEWLDERERGTGRTFARSASEAAWAATRAAQTANTKATIALVIASISVVAAIAAIIVPHFWGANVDANSQAARKQEPPRQYRLGPQ
jgi:hypothetical protein